MTPARQSRFTDGTAGDCLRAAIASVLDLPLVDVPHFVALGSGNWRKSLSEFLLSRDLDSNLVYSRPSGYVVARTLRADRHRIAGWPAVDQIAVQVSA